MYAAVVMTADGTSRSPEGSHAAFISVDKDVATRQALAAARKWNESNNYRRGYYVAVGKLTDKVVTPITYSFEPLDGAPTTNEGA